MKKLLLATTALAMSAGYAAADITLSGDARMGIVYNGNNARELSFTSRARVAFTMSGETDGGLAFGASFRADNSGGAAAGGFAPTSGMTAGSVFISGEFGRITMGDTAGAAEFIVGDLAAQSLTGLGSNNEMFYISNSPSIYRPTARYDYSLDGLTLALSVENPATAAFAYSLGASYEMSGFSAGIGYEKIQGGGNHAIGFVAAEFQGVEGKLIYGRNNASQDQYGLSVSGTFDATTVTVYGRRDFAAVTHYGLGASYDLGGGASVVGGIAKSTGTTAVADFGLAFSF